MQAMTGHSNAAIGRFGATSVSAATLNGAWSLIGPLPMSEKANFTGSTFGSDAMMTGRITSVAADATGLIVAGAASGGLWVSTNAGASFTSVFDGQPTQAIGAIALDTTTSPSTIYVGTGEGNNSLDSLYGAGFFKSTDLGADWTPLANGIFGNTSFTSLAIDTTTTPGTPRLFAGTTNGYSASRGEAGIFESNAADAGLWLSTNGGMSWVQFPESTFGGCDLISNGSNMAPCPADDVEIDPANAQNVYVAIDGQDIYSSNNGGQTFTAASLRGSPSFGRASLAIGPEVGSPNGPSNPTGGAVYAMVGDFLGVAYSGLFVSFDSGTTWNPSSISSTEPTVPSFTSNNVTIDGISDNNNFSQSFYDQAMLVSPTDASTVFFGGVGLYKSPANFGHSWNFIASNGAVHRDAHAMIWDPANNQILLGTDGGLYQFDPTTNTPTFISLNQNINAGQIQGIGPHPTDSTQLVAGFQDNGTQLYSGSVSTWFAPDTETGDGGFAFFDPTNPAFVYHDFSTDEINGALISASSNGGQTWCSAPTSSAPCNVGDQEWSPALQTQLTNDSDIGPAFYAPIAVDPTVAQRVFYGAHGVYVSTDGMAHWAQQTDQDLTSPGISNGAPEGAECEQTDCSLEDLEFSPANHIRAWTLAMSSMDGSVEFELNNTVQANVQLDTNHTHGGLWNDVTTAVDTALKKTNPTLGALATQATSIAPDPHNSNVAYLGLSGFTADTLVGHIYKTVNFGQTWTESDSGLPDVPVLKLLVDANDDSGTCATLACSNSIFAGTDIGIFHSSDGGASWQPFNNGLLTVPVYDIEQNSNGVIFAGTHGRGAFQFVAATATPTATATSTSSATPTATATASATGTATATATSTAVPTPTAVASGARIVAPGLMNMGAVPISQSDSKVFNIRNAGRGTLSGSIQVLIPPPSGASVFKISPTTFNIAPGQSAAETVTFAPDALRDAAAAIVSTNDASRPSIGVLLTGVGEAGRLAVARTLRPLATAGQTGQTSLAIRNVGRGFLSGNWAPVSVGPYTVTAGSFGPIAPGATATIPVTFNPTVRGNAPTAALAIEVTGPSTGSTVVMLRGLGR